MLIQNVNKRDLKKKTRTPISIEPHELKLQEKLMNIFDNTDEDVVAFLSYFRCNHLEIMETWTYVVKSMVE